MGLLKLMKREKFQPSEKIAPAHPNADRCLTLLIEGVARNVPDVDAEVYKNLRANVSSLALQIPDHLPEADKLVIIQSILNTFESYRTGSENAIRERRSGWRSLMEQLLREHLSVLGIDDSSPSAALALKRIPTLITAEDIRSYRQFLGAFLHPAGPNSMAAEASVLKTTDHSTANDNAAGLHGGGVAVEYLKKIMERGSKGFIVLFRLGCLEIIHERFGGDAVQDCLMAVSAFLTHSLHSDDHIYHWSDSTLLAILLGRVSEKILSAELRRIASQNREITIDNGGHSIMVRIPLEFEITSIECLRSAEDLCKLSISSATQW